MAKMTELTSTEAVGVFADAESLQNAIDELLSSGFNRAELSLLASGDAVRQKLGHIYTAVEDLEDDPVVPRTAYLSTESLGDAEGAILGALIYVGAGAAAGAVVASGGALAAALTAAVAMGGAAGVIGSILAKLVGDHHAEAIEQQLYRGGLLIWVRTRDRDHEDRAKAILAKHSGHDVHVYTLPVPSGKSWIAKTGLKI